jgi:membrane associated rhomboid family serine protease
MNLSASPFGGLTPAVKNLIIINAILFMASMVLYSTFGLRIEDHLGLHLPTANAFNPFQMVGYMFLHANFPHLFFNMFALFMFGRLLESVWGTKRFLFYYFVTGIGAALIHIITQYMEVMPLLNAISDYMNNPSHADLKMLLVQKMQPRTGEMQQLFLEFSNSYNQLHPVNADKAASIARDFLIKYREAYLNSFVTIGASGSVFGILLAFGMLFPNTQLMLLFPPIPIKAKYFVIIYGLIELTMGIRGSEMDNVAHWAHLGGMLFGFILIKYWKNRGIYY